MTKSEVNRFLSERMQAIMLKKGLSEYMTPGKYLETALASMVRTYVVYAQPSVPNDKKLDAKTSLQADILRGTDLIIEDPARTVSSRRILRIDATLGFSKKDCMPLATPHTTSLAGDSRKDPFNRGILYVGDDGSYFQFGVRVGNARRGFDEPVIVAGLKSSRELDPENIMANVLWFQNNILDNAPKLIQMAGAVQQRFSYMTSPKYRKQLDEEKGPDWVRRNLPVLVPNRSFIGDEQERMAGVKKPVRGTTCKVSHVSPMGELDRDRDLNTRTFESGIPWMSPCAHAAIKAMLGTPRRLQPSDESVIARLLDEPVRGPEQRDPIITLADNRTVVTKEFSAAMAALAEEMRKRYDESEPYNGPYPWLEKP